MVNTKAKKTAAHPVSIRVLPVVRCALCPASLPHERQPGAAQAVLTEHYNARHLDEITAARAATG